jgi:pyruvate dehydrogenase E1 component alpha subunit
MEVKMQLSEKEMVGLYEMMVKIRLFEEKIADLNAQGFIPGLVHPYIGQEAVAVGVCKNLRKEDYITSTHRGHGHVIAKGAELKYMMAELFGKKTGYCKGKGGSMHISDIRIGILGAMGVVGSGIPIGVGAALSSKMRKTGQVTVCFFGDGASNTGAFHEGLNLAAVHRVPAVFVCENNLYGISVPQRQHQAIQDISVRAAGYGMPGITADGNDVVAVYETSGEAIQRARLGEGPTLIEYKTYRWRGHHTGDPNQGRRYRPMEEIQEWIKKCPIKRWGETLTEKKLLDEAKIKKIQEEIEKEIEEAVSFAKESPFPDPQDIFEDVYARKGVER